ncbi:MAG: hypothetical protein MJH10_11310 [Epibacterium sp.]|nr:hypothetical protein [Epibacterium sp.]NQX74135.1 hypothetical protein [Epibacterium sp.]
MNAYRFGKFAQVHATAEAAKYKGQLPWVKIPTSLDSIGLIELTTQPDGWALYGVACGLLQLAAQQPKRGLFVSESGRALSPAILAATVRCPVALMESTLAALVQNGWLEEVPPDQWEDPDRAPTGPRPDSDPGPTAKKKEVRGKNKDHHHQGGGSAQAPEVGAGGELDPFNESDTPTPPAIESLTARAPGFADLIHAAGRNGRRIAKHREGQDLPRQWDLLLRDHGLEAVAAACQDVIDRLKKPTFLAWPDVVAAELTKSQEERQAEAQAAQAAEKCERDRAQKIESDRIAAQVRQRAAQEWLQQRSGQKIPASQLPHVRWLAEHGSSDAWHTLKKKCPDISEEIAQLGRELQEAHA